MSDFERQLVAFTLANDVSKRWLQAVVLFIAIARTAKEGR